MLLRLFLWQRKAGFLMMDHASLFTESVHPYLPKLYILIYRKCTLLFTDFGTLLFTDDNVSMNGYLIQLIKPCMQFLFISTDLCSPAYFSAWITPNHLAAC